AHGPRGGARRSVRSPLDGRFPGVRPGPAARAGWGLARCAPGAPVADDEAGRREPLAAARQPSTVASTAGAALTERSQETLALAHAPGRLEREDLCARLGRELFRAARGVVVHDLDGA